MTFEFTHWKIQSLLATPYYDDEDYPQKGTSEYVCVMSILDKEMDEYWEKESSDQELTDKMKCLML